MSHVTLDVKAAESRSVLLNIQIYVYELSIKIKKLSFFDFQNHIHSNQILDNSRFLL
jgi:hypothetical protein